jgi:hypothetical protein
MWICIVACLLEVPLKVDTNFADKQLSLGRYSSLCGLKPRSFFSTGSQHRQPLLRNSSTNTLVARQCLNSPLVIAETNTHATIEELLETVISVLPVPRLYNEDQLPLRTSLETAVRREGGRCEMAVSLRGREAGSKGTSTVGRRYQAAQWGPWLRTLVSVRQWSVKCSHELCVKVFNNFYYQSKPRTCDSIHSAVGYRTKA